VTDATDLAPAPNPGLTDQRSDWEDPPRVARTDVAPVLSVDGFAGPLDWFLEMARTKKLDLTQLSIGALVEQFADALAAALVGHDPRQLDRWAGWTVMAATLTELWSRLLLPADAAASRTAEAEAEALRRQLLARARMRQAADWLERRSQLGRDVFARRVPGAGVAGRGSDLTDLLRACLVALHVPEAQMAAYRPRPPPLWRVSDAIPHLRQRLAALPDDTPLAALLPPIDGDDPGKALRCRAAVASTLVAGLELARDGPLALEQDEPWADIRVSRRRDHDAGPAGTAVIAESASPV
jgi:segregation and condensation protein A